MSGRLNPDRAFSELAKRTGSDTAVDRAPARLKSRVYSRLLAEQAATGPLLGLAETRDAGRPLCVFEMLVAEAPLPATVKTMNLCRVCHARHLAEHLDRAPIFWPHCPYSDYQRR